MIIRSSRPSALTVSLVLALGLVAAACGSTEIADPSLTGDTLTAEEAAEVEENQGRLSGDVPAIEPGNAAFGKVDIDGTTIEYYTITPEGFTEGDSAPVLLAIPPGGQTIEITQRVIVNTYLTEAVERGWVVISPAAPGGTLFFDGSEDRIPGLLDWVGTWVDAEGGRPHLAGISNGGLSAFRLAAENPDDYASIIAFPGFPRSGDTDALENLTGIPIRLFVGEFDEGWVPRMEETFNTVEGLGGDIELEIVPGEGHIISDLQDGNTIFELLDSFR